MPFHSLVTKNSHSARHDPYRISFHPRFCNSSHFADSLQAFACPNGKQAFIGVLSEGTPGRGAGSGVPLRLRMQALGEGHTGEPVLPGLVHEPGDIAEPVVQLAGDLAPPGVGLFAILPGKAVFTTARTTGLRVLPARTRWLRPGCAGNAPGNVASRRPAPCAPQPTATRCRTAPVSALGPSRAAARAGRWGRPGPGPDGRPPLRPGRVRLSADRGSADSRSARHGRGQ